MDVSSSLVSSRSQTLALAHGGFEKLEERENFKL
jgi:hypothetical protein